MIEMVVKFTMRVLVNPTMSGSGKNSSTGGGKVDYGWRW